MPDYSEETDGVFSIRRTSEDKLTYKNIIADAINDCRRNKGKIFFNSKVQALEDIINFDVTGYKLMSQIENIKQNIEEERIEYLNIEKEKLGNKFYSNANQAKLKLKMSKWYWERYYVEIIRLLAKENLLLETEKKISVRADE